MRKENIVKSGDKCYKAVQAADGGQVWREVQVPREITASEVETSGRVSELIFKTLEAGAQALVGEVVRVDGCVFLGESVAVC
jgi:hypothetical protein